MNLLTIPNDSIEAYMRCPEDDFLSEFNPLINRKRFFDEVAFLNWKQQEEKEYAGIKSYPLLDDKKEAELLTDKLAKGEIPFSYPLYKNIFKSEREKIKKVINKFNPNFIKTTIHPFAIELGVIARDYAKIPLVIVANDISRITSGLKEADSLICISNVLKERCIKDYNIPQEKITIISDGIDMEEFYPREENEIKKIVPDYLDAKYKILSVSRLVNGKNIETVLESISKLKEKISIKDLIYLHIGSQPDEAKKTEIEKLRKDLGLEEAVHFLGPIEKRKLPFYYSWAQIHVLPTLWEGLGRANIEALSCGTPCITTNYPPMTEVVQNNYNGLTINPHNPKEIALALEKILFNSSKKEKLKQNARESVQRYDIKKVMSMHVDNYEKLLEK